MKSPIERCDCTVIHDEIVNTVKGKMPEEEILYDLAELFEYCHRNRPVVPTFRPYNAS